jgi:general secretion pathway protein D
MQRSVTGLNLGIASGSQCTINESNSSSSTSTVTVPCDIALVSALQSDTHADVLSASTLLTADNEEAMIVVGENLPFIGSSSATSALSGQIFNSVDRQNVGITLDVIPQVSEGDYVRLDLYEEVSNVVSGTDNNTNGPTTTIRSASTTVFVQDHRTTVIGGLISTDDEKTNEGVPFISDIPVIGQLFNNLSRSKQKQNLLVFLTPHVIRTRADLHTLALDERQKFIDSLGRKEVNDMPPSQINELYNPGFSVAVPPETNLNTQSSTALSNIHAPTRPS